MSNKKIDFIKKNEKNYKFCVITDFKKFLKILKSTVTRKELFFFNLREKKIKCSSFCNISNFNSGCLKSIKGSKVTF